MHPLTDGGYFPRGESILRRVQEERVVGLLYGQRALVLGAMMHPLAFYGTNAHTAAKERPFQRLVHTAKVFETVFFGTREEADVALGFVRRLHERVRGTTREDLGPWPSGTPYSALDPEQMMWGVVAATFDSALVIYETFVRRLSADELEAMWQDYIRFGELFGMPRGAAPATYRGFRAAWDERIVSDRVFLTAEAREAGYATGFEIPVPIQNRPRGGCSSSSSSAPSPSAPASYTGCAGDAPSRRPSTPWRSRPAARARSRPATYAAVAAGTSSTVSPRPSAHGSNGGSPPRSSSPPVDRNGRG